MKKNKKGFTLVELIVVMAMMGVIMTGVLMIMKPTNTLYNKVSDSRNQEAGCIALSEAISNQIKYSRYTYVYSTTKSSPPDYSTISKELYSHVIILDNSAVRTGAKKNVLGSFTYADYNGSSAFSNSKNLVENATLDNYNYRLTVQGKKVGSATNNNNYIGIDFYSYPQQWNGSSYVADESAPFKMSKNITFTNMNRRAMLSTKAVGGISIEESSKGANEIVYIFYSDPDTTATTTTTTATP